jgi:hypothetical protein
MLKNRILSTVLFFDLQDYPLTLLELQRYLLPEREELLSALNNEREVVKEIEGVHELTKLSQILTCLEQECKEEIAQKEGFYCLKGRTIVIDQRLQNYIYSFARERRIKKWARFLRHVPFVRGVAVGGSQTLGRQKPESDIDLFLVVDKAFMWLARILVTGYFEIIGQRRHDNKIANRFCLNHYVGGPKLINELKNLYSAMEYTRHRPVVYPQGIQDFHKRNKGWMKTLYPNWETSRLQPERQSSIQKFLELVLAAVGGKKLEKFFEGLQKKRIHIQPFIIVEPDELSFHPDSKQESLLDQFFKKLPASQIQAGAGAGSGEAGNEGQSLDYPVPT